MIHTTRDARPEDLPALRAIQLATLAEPWPELLDLAVQGPPLLIVCGDPDPLGYALALPGERPDAGERETVPPADTERARPADGALDVNRVEGADRAGTGDGDAYLVELAVATPRQGEGLGSALLSALVDRLSRDGYRRLLVTARDVDERVLEFYRSHGFTLERRLPDHYDAGDGRLLVRDLDE